jgi:hypothetical protein
MEISTLAQRACVGSGGDTSRVRYHSAADEDLRSSRVKTSLCRVSLVIGRRQQPQRGLQPRATVFTPHPSARGKKCDMRQQAQAQARSLL